MTTPNDDELPRTKTMAGTQAGALATPVDPARAAALLWQQSPDIAFVVLDTAGTITAWQGASAAMFGYAEGEIVGQPIDVLFVHEDRALGLPVLERQVAVSARNNARPRELSE